MKEGGGRGEERPSAQFSKSRGLSAGVSYSCSTFFAPKLRRNACYDGYSKQLVPAGVGVGAGI